MRSTLALALLGLLCFGCSSKDEDPQPSNTEEISAQKWKYDNGGIDGNNDGTVDFNFPPGTLQDCVLDNEVSFSSNGTGVADEGATKCNASSPQTTPFTWNFSSNETLLQVSGQGVFGLSGQFKVRELTGTRFTLAKDTTMPGSSQNVQLLVSLKH